MRAVIKDLPLCMRDLKRDKRGYPIPMTVLLHKDGTPDFRVINHEKAMGLLRDRRCALTGKKIMPTRSFALVGGVQSAFHDNGAYTDYIMRPDAALFALRTCPYLAMPKYFEKQFKPKGEAPDDIVTYEHTPPSDRPEVFVMVEAKHFKMIPGPVTVYVKPLRLYERVSFWRNGEQLKYAEAKKIDDRIPELHELGRISRYLSEPLEEA